MKNLERGNNLNSMKITRIHTQEKEEENRRERARISKKLTLKYHRSPIKK